MIKKPFSFILIFTVILTSCGPSGPTRQEIIDKYKDAFQQMRAKWVQFDKSLPPAGSITEAGCNGPLSVTPIR